MANILKRAFSSTISKDDPASPKGPMSLSAKSPSFNDFSLFAQDDAEEFQGTNQNQSLSARSSLDAGAFPGTNQNQPLSARSSLDSDRQPLSPRWSYIFGTQYAQPSAPREIPQKPAPAHSKQALDQKDQKGAKTLPRQPEGKIGGMSYHEYCDLLIRSSSL